MREYLSFILFSCHKWKLQFYIVNSFLRLLSSSLSWQQCCNIIICTEFRGAKISRSCADRVTTSNADECICFWLRFFSLFFRFFLLFHWTVCVFCFFSIRYNQRRTNNKIYAKLTGHLTTIYRYCVMVWKTCLAFFGMYIPYSGLSRTRIIVVIIWPITIKYVKFTFELFTLESTKWFYFRSFYT